MIVTSVRENALPSGTEPRLAAFTELIAATIANAQARQVSAPFDGTARDEVADGGVEVAVGG